MSNIEILTKGYADSVFASGPVVKEITSSDGSVSVFVNGPTVDLKVKSGGDPDKLVTKEYVDSFPVGGEPSLDEWPDEYKPYQPTA